MLIKINETRWIDINRIIHIFVNCMGGYEVFIDCRNPAISSRLILDKESGKQLIETLEHYSRLPK